MVEGRKMYILKSNPPYGFKFGSTMASYFYQIIRFYLLLSTASLLRFVNTTSNETMTSAFGILENVEDTVKDQVDLAANLMKQFEEFMLTYGKTYSSMAERMIRFANFKTNLKIIELLNEASDGTVEYGVNVLSDLTFEEYKSRLNFKPNLNWTQGNDLDNAEPRERRNFAAALATIHKAADSAVKGEGVDLTKDFYPPVEAQEKCGACYTFSISGAISIAYSKRMKKVVNLSEQQLIDCTKEAEDGCDQACTKNAGCNGGDFPQTFKYAKETGMVLESDYPYKGEDGTCPKVLKPVAFVDTYEQVHGMPMFTALMTTPLPACVNAKKEEFQHYKSGILRPDPCDPRHLSHAIVLVGFRRVEKEIIIKVRNSWGPGWGEEGHFEMPFGLCGLDKFAFKFTLK